MLSLFKFSEHFPCSNCGRRYKYLRNLKTHQQYECGVDRRFKCNICDSKFKRKQHLECHFAKMHKIPTS